MKVFLLSILACLFSSSVVSQVSFIDNSHCDTNGKREYNIMKVLVNFQNSVMVNRIETEGGRIQEVVDISQIPGHCNLHLINHTERAVFKIVYHEESETSERILQCVQQAYQSMSFSEDQWKICYVSGENDPMRPPPPALKEGEDIDDDTPFMIVESMPAIGPCLGLSGNERNQCTQLEIIKHISSNTTYPPIAKDAGIQGTVFVYFVVGKNGKVRDVKVLREVDPHLDKEAVRVIESLPTFEPGQQRGKPVSVQYTIPVKFVRSAE